MKKLFSSYLSLTILTLLFSPVLSASIVVNGTRVIYPSSAREISVKMTNMGKRPLLIQSWIDDGDMTAKPENIRVPFVLSPPFNRVDAGKGQTLRISQTDPDLPEDRESVFWLNILEIPAKNPTMEEKIRYKWLFVHVSNSSIARKNWQVTPAIQSKCLNGSSEAHSSLPVTLRLILFRWPISW